MEPPTAENATRAAAASPDLQKAKPTTETAAAKPPNALTPPTSEEMNHNEGKKDHDDSELSDLDLDDDEDDDIQPDHYWDEENGGRIPVFKPTMDQFRSFKKFMEKVDKYGMKSGIVKVIPPPEWREHLPDLQEYVKRIKIKNPITQEFNGTQGIYTQQNVEKQRSYNLPEWKALTEETQHQPPAKRGERRRNQEKVVRGGGNQRTRGPAATSALADPEESPTQKKKPGRPKRGQAAADAPESGDESKTRRSSGRTQVPPTPDSPATKPAKNAKPKGGRASKGGPGQAKSVTSRRLNNTAESADFVDEKAFKHFHHGMDDLDEYTPERCAELESHYWRSLGFNQPMYAADMPGSLFDDSVTSWNVAKLENLLDVLGTKVPGVNTAYLYMGMWKATFAWHLEDVDLYSINYIHFGAPKQWYSISQEDARKFEKAMKQVWPVDAKNCDQFLRHKTYLISPDVLQKQYGVKVNKLVHYEGEFVITFPYGYHSGYNIGYNCAESVNFATESWLDYGRIARKCNCESDNVWVNVAEIERKLRGEPTPEYIEETDDETDAEDEDGNLPTPPASVRGKPVSKKRKRGAKQEEPKRKKKIRIRLKAPTREPCVMCPNDNPWEELITTDNGRKAHRSCALFTPETYIISENGSNLVCGVTTIDRARLELKCNFCRSKRGACFQCSAKKCTRAFHASCALAAGVQIDSGMVPTFGEDGTEYYEEGYDFRCKYHRPRMPRNLNLETLESSKRILNYAKELKHNDVLQAQLPGGDVFAGLVVDNRPGELNFLVDVLPEGERVEVDYKWICVMDPNDSQRPKPSSNAVAMPEGMKKEHVSIMNRQDGVPSQDNQFHDNPDYRWHDFYNVDMPPPGYQSSRIQAPTRLKVNVHKPDQLYFYLGEISTEAKVYFTDKPGSKEIATKANFMERAQPSRPVHRYQPPKHVFPVQPRSSQQAPKQFSHPAPTASAQPSEKPYTYKPKDPARPNNVMWGVDQAALANQRNFIQSGGRRASQQFGLLQDQQEPNQLCEQNGSPPRPFPSEQYYSMTTLPAAYPGQHSGFTQAVRRQSQVSQTMQRPNSQQGVQVPNYQSVRQQQTIFRQPPPQSQHEMLQRTSGAPMVPMMGGGSPTGAQALPADARRPSSSMHSQPSPYGAPLTPATTRSTVSVAKPADGPETDREYLTDLQKYPYLLKSYCRKPKVYESPYALGGGFSSPYQRTNSPEQNSQRSTSHAQTPQASIASLDQTSRPQSQNQPWTPPSQMWDRVGFAVRQSSPAPTHQFAPPTNSQPNYNYGPALSQRPQATHSTPQEFQRQILAPLPSTASREGAEARRLRERGFIPNQTQPPMAHAGQRNSFGQHGYSGSAGLERIWGQESPKAPTASPLSDSNTPGSRPPGAMVRADVAPMGQRPQVMGMQGAVPWMGGELQPERRQE